MTDTNNSSKTANSLAKNLADSAWQRLRSLALTTAKYDNFVQLGESHLPENGDGSKRDLSGDESSADKLALDFLLMNLAESFDKENTLILLSFEENEAVTASELSSLTGISDLALRERLGQMRQTGLISKNIDSGKFSLSESGESIVGLIREALNYLIPRIPSELPEITGEIKEQT